MKPSVSKRRQGFNILEMRLLLVIIIVQAVFLFPEFCRARDNAHRSSCQSNLKQIAFAFNQYIQDNDKKYPPPNAINVGTGAHGWVDMIQAYSKSVQIFQCPSDATNSPAEPTSKGYTDYWMNANVVGKSQAAFTATANTFLMGDTDTSKFGQSDHSATYDGTRDGNSTKTTQNGSRITNWYTALGPGASPAQQNAASTKHLDGANYAFADGHVKWMKNNKPSNATGKALTNGSFSFRVN